MSNNRDVESDVSSLDEDLNDERERFVALAEKRARQAALARQRRDLIKVRFTHLSDSVPSLQGEKMIQAQILQKTTEYVQFMRRQNYAHQQDIEDLKIQIKKLKTLIRSMENL